MDNDIQLKFMCKKCYAKKMYSYKINGRTLGLKCKICGKIQYISKKQKTERIRKVISKRITNDIKNLQSQLQKFTHENFDKNSLRTFINNVLNELNKIKYDIQELSDEDTLIFYKNIKQIKDT